MDCLDCQVQKLFDCSESLKMNMKRNEYYDYFIYKILNKYFLYIEFKGRILEKIKKHSSNLVGSIHLNYSYKKRINNRTFELVITVRKDRGADERDEPEIDDYAGGIRFCVYNTVSKYNLRIDYLQSTRIEEYEKYFDDYLYRIIKNNIDMMK